MTGITMSRRRKKHAEAENHERWLISYADFITLLFAFFVVMFASSQTDKTKAQAMAQAVKDAFEKGRFSTNVTTILGGTIDDLGKGNAQMRGPGGATPVISKENEQRVAELLPSLKRLNEDLQEEIRKGQIQVSLEARGLVVSLKQAAFFPSGEDSIAPAMYPALERVATVIQKLPNPVRMEGHTDSVPIHNE